MTIALLPGIRQRIYLGGWSLDNGPSVFEPAVEEAKTSQRLANGTLFTSYSALWTGAPSRITKRDWLLAFDAPSQADLLHLRMLGGTAQQVDFCPWLAEAEPFASPTDGTPTAGRRNATDVIDAGLVPTGTWTAKFVEADDTEHAVTWGTPDAGSPWRQAFTVPTLPLGESLLNGGFDADLSDWTAGAGWAWSAGGAEHTAGNTATLSQSVTCVNGRTYAVDVSISGRTAGSISITLGSETVVTGLTATPAAPLTVVCVTAGGTETLTITPTSDFDGTIDSISLQVVVTGWLVYFPVYRVEVQTPKIAFQLAHQEKHALALKEV